MKRHFAPSLVALSLCALLGGARAAGAQDVVAIVPTPVDSVVVRAGAETSQQPVVPVAPVLSGPFAPVMRPFAPISSPDVRYPAVLPSSDVAVVQGRDWKMPTSRTLMIGGTAVALVGLLAVKGDAGAIMALTGGGVAVYGLYLHYNR